MKYQLPLILPVLSLIAPVPVQATQLDKIDHIIVIYLENHSFDNLYGTFPEQKDLLKQIYSKLNKLIQQEILIKRCLTSPKIKDFQATCPINLLKLINLWHLMKKPAI